MIGRHVDFGRSDEHVALAAAAAQFAGGTAAWACAPTKEHRAVLHMRNSRSMYLTIYI
jgi:hypothetical protein